jgi:hypothetical protein
MRSLKSLVIAVWVVILLFVVAVLASEAHGAEPEKVMDDSIIKESSDVIAALKCRKRGYKFFERQRDSDWVICLNDKRFAPYAKSVESVLR